MFLFMEHTSENDSQTGNKTKRRRGRGYGATLGRLSAARRRGTSGGCELAFANGRSFGVPGRSRGIAEGSGSVNCVGSQSSSTGADLRTEGYAAVGDGTDSLSVYDVSDEAGREESEEERGVEVHGWMCDIQRGKVEKRRVEKRRVVMRRERGSTRLL